MLLAAILAILAMRLSVGVGLPSLLVYLGSGSGIGIGIGIALGESVIGIQFDNAGLAHVAVSIALVAVPVHYLLGA